MEDLTILMIVESFDNINTCDSSLSDFGFTYNSPKALYSYLNKDFAPFLIFEQDTHYNVYDQYDIDITYYDMFGKPKFDCREMVRSGPIQMRILFFIIAAVSPAKTSTSGRARSA